VARGKAGRIIPANASRKATARGSWPDYNGNGPGRPATGHEMKEETRIYSVSFFQAPIKNTKKRHNVLIYKDLNMKKAVVIHTPYYATRQCKKPNCKDLRKLPFSVFCDLL
jgi:hypothetical protein